MPASNQVFAPGTGVYEIIRCDASNAFVAMAVNVDGSGNPLWQIGRCTDLYGNGFVVMLEINTVTGVLKVNNVAVTVP
jgi:hypothetical protein